jgi:hypothetical protein
VYCRDRLAGGPSLYFAAVNAEFNWWLLIVGLVVGAGLAWFVLMDARRRDVDIDERERPREALWLARMLTDEGHPVSPEAADRLLVLHRSYLEAPPPDEPEPAAPPTDTPSALSDPTPTGRPPGGAATAPPPVGEPASGSSELSRDDRIGAERRPPDVRQ